jgi:hypothetical protein
MSTRPNRLAWLRLNAYGVLLAGLALMGVTDLINPGGANLARVVGEVPPGQNFWVAGLIISGALLMWGFARADRLIETAGLGLLSLSVAAQTFVAWRLLGWTDFTLTRLALFGIVVACSTARISALWSRSGLIITIPARRGRE